MLWTIPILFVVALSAGFGHTVRVCFRQTPVCNVDDSKFPPYVTFNNQLGERVCKETCLGHNSQGVLVFESKLPQFCQLAVSLPGFCKLYYQPNIKTGCRNDRGYVESKCFRLQSGCPGFKDGSVEAETVHTDPPAPPTTFPTTMSTTTTSSTAPPTTTAGKFCFLDPKQGLQLQSNALEFLLDKSEFDGSVDDCKAKCKSNPKCSSLNYYPTGNEPNSDPAQCILHDVTCDASDANSQFVCAPRPDTVYYEKDPKAPTDCK